MNIPTTIKLMIHNKGKVKTYTLELLDDTPEELVYEVDTTADLEYSVHIPKQNRKGVND